MVPKLNRVLAGILLAGSSLAAAELVLLFHSARTSLDSIAVSAKQTLDDLDATVLIARGAIVNANLVLGRIEAASQSWQTVAIKEARYWEQLQARSLATLDKINAASDSLNAMIQNTDASLNGDLLPKVSESAGAITATIKTMEESLLEASGRANIGLDDIHRLLSDPVWQASLANVQASTDDIAATTEQIRLASDHLPDIAADLAKISETSSRYAKPLLIARVVSLLSWIVPWLF